MDLFHLQDSHRQHLIMQHVYIVTMPTDLGFIIMLVKIPFPLSNVNSMLIWVYNSVDHEDFVNTNFYFLQTPYNTFNTGTGPFYYSQPAVLCY